MAGIDAALAEVTRRVQTPLKIARAIEQWVNGRVRAIVNEVAARHEVAPSLLVGRLGSIETEPDDEHRAHPVVEHVRGELEEHLASDAPQPAEDSAATGTADGQNRSQAAGSASAAGPGAAGGKKPPAGNVRP